MHFHYRLVKTSSAVPSLGGRWVRPRPVIGVTILGPLDSRYRTAMLDTGADDTVFPESLAPVLGVDLTHALTGTAAGVGGKSFLVKYAQVRLRLTDGREYREWPAWVGFTSAPLAPALLGFAGCLQFFSALFHGDREEVELTVNSLYPGT